MATCGPAAIPTLIIAGARRVTIELIQSLRRAATVRPNAIAAYDGELQPTWAELDRAVHSLAAGLAGLGVARGDRVAILAGNGLGYYQALFALFALGAVAVPLNTRLAPPELAFQIGDAGARVLLTDAGLAETAQGLRSAGIELLVDLGLGASAPGCDHAIDALIAALAPLRPAPIEDSALAGIFYTGGTTGLPKGVMLSHRNLYSMAAGLVMQLQLDEDAVVLHSAPMFHLADFAIFVVTLVAGTHVFIPALDDATMLNAIERYRVTHSFTVPAVIDRIARSESLASRDLSALKVLGYGGAPMPWGTYCNAREKLPGIDFVQGFGMTEMPSHTFLGARYHRAGADPGLLRSAGQAGYGYEVRIVDAAGNPLPPGTLGEIAGRGDNVMLGYWNRPEETAQALRGDWMHSGDAGYMDEAGFVYITDRFKDMIVTGGENVYSIEVESVVSTHPAVLECAVIGVPDDKWGERVHAVVSLRPGAALDPDTLIAHCRGQLAGYKIPRSLQVHDGPLPRSAAGKVQKAVLRAPHWEGR